MWKQHNFINKESNQAQESADTMLASLISRKLLTEDEIDREQELITIKKKDGTVIKEISYSSVTINISKTPATDKSRAVVLRATATGTIIPNIDMSNGKEEFNNWVNSLNEEQKKEIIRKAYIKYANLIDSNANCKTFQDVLDWLKNKNKIKEATETAFWNAVESDGGIDKHMGVVEVFGNNDTKMIEGYTVTNPANEISNTYIAMDNGTYTFKVQDVVTGKTYTKKVEVTNVDTSLPEYALVSEKNIRDDSIDIMLKFELTGEYTEFENAYIIFKGEKIDISSIINDKEKKVNTGNIRSSLYNQGKLSKEDNFWGTTQTIILVKDGKEYTGEAIMKKGKDL